MCGIAGWVDFERDLTNETKAVPGDGANIGLSPHQDADGLWLSASAAFAHRRLIVVDPSGGLQPMVRQYGDHTYAITYNGELYNTEDIRKESARLRPSAFKRIQIQKYC